MKHEICIFMALKFEPIKITITYVVDLIDQNLTQHNGNKLLAHRPRSNNALKGKPVHKA